MISLHGALDPEFDEEHPMHDVVALAPFDEDALRALVSPNRLLDGDSDRGPYEAWRAAHVQHVQLPFVGWTLVEEHYEHRLSAYVFWDLERVQKFDLVEVVSRFEALDYPNEAYDVMEYSMVDRAVIWHRGGQGYWDKDDLSRIVWQ